MNWYFQMFSARNTPLSDSLKIVADAGYHGIEIYRDNLIDIDELKAGIQTHELVVPSMHVNLPQLSEHLSDAIEQARELKCDHIVCPYLEPDDRPTDASQWQALALELGNIDKKIVDAGLTFAWHNHDFEFIALEDGTYPMEHLLETATNMSWEIDVAWIVRAQQNPAIWIDRYLSRLSAVHMKDIAPDGECADEDGWADLGAGVVPWKNLMPSLLRSPASLYITEHDNPSDLQRFAIASIEEAARLSGQT